LIFQLIKRIHTILYRNINDQITGDFGSYGIVDMAMRWLQKELDTGANDAMLMAAFAHYFVVYFLLSKGNVKLDSRIPIPMSTFNN